MRPSAETQVRVGVAVAVVTAAVVAVLALAPDPRQKVYVTAFDDVDGVVRGAPVYFRGATVGEVRSVKLMAERGQFAVRMGVRRDWEPGPCAFAKVVAPLPVTAPRVELVSLEAPACAQARAKAGCEALAAPTDGGAPLPGCRREGDMLANVGVALEEVAKLTRTANLMAGQFQKVIDGEGAPGEAEAARRLMADAGAAVAAANQATARLNASLAPGGDAAASLANLRQASDKAADIDIAELNAAIADLRQVVQRNEASVSTLLSEGAALSGESRTLLRDVSGTLTSAAASLERVSGNLDALSERVGGDPTFVVRGQSYADPPPPGGAP